MTPNHCRGMTLVEVMVGMTVFAVGVLPLVLALGRASSASQVRDLYTAHALLEGEAGVIYHTGEAPSGTRTFQMSGVDYKVVAESTADSGLVAWQLHIERGARRIHSLCGILMLPDSSEEQDPW